jgi:acyl carrier protein
LDKDAVKQVVRDFILVQFLPGEDAASVSDQTQLITDGVLDSLGSLRLVAFLEERFGIKIEAHEVDVDHLDTVELISTMVMEKRAITAR